MLVVAIAAMLPFMACAGKARVLKIDFKNPIQERIVGGSSIDIMSIVKGSANPVTLYSYVSAIDAAAQDNSISMIYMTPDEVDAGLAQIEEIRAALERFKKSGKPVVAYCRTLGNGSYYLASVADKIILDPASESLINGLSTQMIFLKDILDALHVDIAPGTDLHALAAADALGIGVQQRGLLFAEHGPCLALNLISQRLGTSPGRRSGRGGTARCRSTGGTPPPSSPEDGADGWRAARSRDIRRR